MEKSKRAEGREGKGRREGRKEGRKEKENRINTRYITWCE